MIGPKISPAFAARMSPQALPQMPAQMPAQKPPSIPSQTSGQGSGQIPGQSGPGGTPDLDPLASAPSRSRRPVSKTSQQPEAVWKAARDFEALVIGQLLQPMFETVNNSKSPFSGGHGEQAFKPMIVQEMAKKIAAGGGFGLAQPIYAQMLRMQEGAPP